PRVGLYDPRDHLILDEAAIRTLELVRTVAGDKQGSLLHLLDQTRSPMGARLLRRRLLAPLIDVAAIRRRLDAVEAFFLDRDRADAFRSELGGVGDVERLGKRVDLGLATPRDLGALRDGLLAAQRAVRGLREGGRAGAEGALGDPLGGHLPEDLCEDIAGMLETALVDAPPVVSNQGGIFREGMDAALDEARALCSGGKDRILELEARERQRTGISSLKIKLNKVFGYFIEVTRSNLQNVPEDFRRKQTIANGERYITPELEELQERILHADEEAKAKESLLFADLSTRVGRSVSRIASLARRLAALDVHAALAEVARRRDYVRPEVDASMELELIESRHPIVEVLAAANEFVPNDVRLDTAERRMMIITGPNMAGKSTAMRQVALAVLMAQAGSYVPARRARVGIADRIFTRVGASDDLGRGQSTFMVEMRETATILRDATERSLVILDEIGRGTSTYDGLAIAWAVAEHLHDGLRARTMFATHYHELCELASTREGASNFNVAALEHDEVMTFLHRLVPGPSNRSYGVAVARLAGLPPIVLARARAILGDLEQGAPLPSGAPARMRRIDAAGRAQLELFAAAEPRASAVEATLGEMDLEHVTPMEALMALARLKGMLPGPERGA
ncbi:MAG: DNA mismatch repair protein MutS, partial [Myxococcales bacterium]|nr:DNA mismatch repair protein MutS [Myxococcales bacterium]